MKQILKNIFEKVIKINRFFRICHILNVNRKYTIVWMYPHIGDAFYALPYIKKYKEKNNVEICLIGNKKYKFLYDKFGGIDKYCLLDEIGVFGFTNSHIGPLMRKILFSKIKKNKYVSNDYNLMVQLFPDHKCKTLQEFTKKNIYKLTDEEITYPVAEKKKLNEKPYIIISPHANTIADIPNEYFDYIIKELGKKYVIYTNVGKNQKELEGTLKLDCGILELADYASCAEAFIGLRSGVCDLVGAMTKTKTFVFFNNYKAGGFASVSDYRNNDNSIVEFYNSDYQSYVEEIVNSIK